MATEDNSSISGEPVTHPMSYDLKEIRASLAGGKWSSASEAATGRPDKVKTGKKEAASTRDRLTVGFKAAGTLQGVIDKQSKDYAASQLFIAEIMGATQGLQMAAGGLAQLAGLTFIPTVPGPKTVQETKQMNAVPIPGCIRDVTDLIERVAEILEGVVVQQAAAKIALGKIVQSTAMASHVDKQAFEMVTSGEVAEIKERSVQRLARVAKVEAALATIEGLEDLLGSA